MVLKLIIVLLFIGVAKGAQWPSDSSEKCSQSTKQKAMYARMTWSPSLRAQPFTSFEVTTEWNDLRFNPISNPQNNGGVYIAYTTGVTGGPGGYFGVQLTAKSGQFLFSFWDEGRFIGSGKNKKPKIAGHLAWPTDMKNCKRHCLDCGLADLRQWRAEGFTTGTKCGVAYPDMKVGDKFKISMVQRESQGAINTADYGGMNKAHKEKLNEQDKVVTGGIWDVVAYDLKRQTQIHVGSMMVEGDGSGMGRLGTFDEMLGCRKCNSVHHKDTRYGLVLDGSRHPINMEGLTQAGKSTCKNYKITGNKRRGSITFEGGPLIKGKPSPDGYSPVW